ncbi:CAMK/CAMK1 protein kinase, variant 3 [Aphanomyces astaci]|uniref:CAMK/CAMK1 protein kinase, variant 3 n=1 Tax=Aphanomyces astaci TaxID=112090 RepID=W4GPQ5_APHAT|nr:CAMK/CAMK1 protein kinase, variant 3 [Aphanomyces astaci]ETV81710.1 CAMK/CAMK1 protein kinase, variant 3 [Aphanomyces astaci]|eukprot:XP_009828447.1 CAMK/CAMK1 protein kinase, variant 3 [Aphanomyces astaci]
MGQVTSWCLGDDEHDHVLTSLKEDRASTRTAASSGASQATGSDQNEQTAIYRSRPKAIMSSGPMYAAGTFENKYALKSVIGNGSTSICHLCEEKATKKHFACKVIDKRAIQSKSDDLLDQFQVEIQVLQSLDHPNIIHMEDVYQTDTRICMVTELMEGGELFDYVVQKGTLSEVEASCLVRKITSAIAYMHACGVVHRDLKPENVLLTSPSPNAEIKIIDFGLAKLLHDSQTRSFLGTRVLFNWQYSIGWKKHCLGEIYIYPFVADILYIMDVLCMGRATSPRKCFAGSRTASPSMYGRLV